MTSKDLLYIPYRKLGVICGDSKISVAKLGEELFYTVACGNFFQVFRGDKLNVVMRSRSVDGEISHICTSSHDTFVAVKNRVFRYRRAHLVGQVTELPSVVKGLLCVGDILLCYDDSNTLMVCNIKASSLASTIKLLHSARISSILHPAAYLNKFVIGYSDGQLELWNIKTKKLIYEFQAPKKKFLQFTSAGVTAMAQSPASDIISVGFSSGDIIILNLRLDTVLFHFRQKGDVTNISFRSDLLTSKFPYVLSSSIQGHIYIWSVVTFDDDSKSVVKLVHTILRAHNGTIITLQFLPSEPVFVTTGTDNAIKMWIFDNPDGSVRLLKSRQGLSKYPLQLRYFGDLSHSNIIGQEVYSIMSGLIAADADGRLLFTRIEKDYDFQELSQHSLDSFTQRRLSACIDFDFTYTGSKPWGDLLSVHKDTSDSFLWKVEEKSSTKTVLRYPGTDNRSVSKISGTAVKVSSCGNFGVVGYSDGLVAKFNIQSGLHRGLFHNFEKLPLNVIGKVSGLYLDAANITLISIHAHGYIISWNFQTLQMRHFHHLPSGLTKLSGSVENNFIAVADEDFIIRLFDIETFQVCRIFDTKHLSQITDVIFTADCRRIITSSDDHTVQVWDISTSQRLSWCKFSSAVTSLALTPAGDLLIARNQCKEVLLCVDRGLVDNLGLSGSCDHPIDITQSYNSVNTEETSDECVIPPICDFGRGECSVSSSFINSRPKIEDGLTLSAISKSYWTTLCNLELIQKRNKLVRPVEKVSIPFFIPLTSAQIDQKVVKTETSPEVLQAASIGSAPLIPTSSSKILKRKKVFRNKLIEMLCDDQRISQQDLLAYFTSLSPTELDFQLRNVLDYDQTLSPDQNEIEAIQHLFDLLEQCLKERQNFELLQAILHRILLIHSPSLIQLAILQPSLLQLHSTQLCSGQSLQNMLHITLCLIKKLLNIPFT